MKNKNTPHSIKLQSNTLVHGRAVLSVSALLRRDKPHRPEIIWAAVFADGHQSQPCLIGSRLAIDNHVVAEQADFCVAGNIDGFA
jgi:hypothetical protein